MIPKRIQSIIDSLKQTHREILEVIESTRPERELEKAQADIVKLCRKLASQSAYKKQTANEFDKRIRLRTGNLEIRVIDRDTLCYVGVMKDGYMVAAFTYFTESAYASDQTMDPAFRTDDLRAFINHKNPKSLVLERKHEDSPVIRYHSSMTELVGKLIHPEVFAKADITTSDIYAAHPNLKRKHLENDLSL
jgi:hypothetical protein